MMNDKTILWWSTGLLAAACAVTQAAAATSAAPSAAAFEAAAAALPQGLVCDPPPPPPKPSGGGDTPPPTGGGPSAPRSGTGGGNPSTPGDTTPGGPTSGRPGPGFSGPTTPGGPSGPGSSGPSTGGGGPSGGGFSGPSTPGGGAASGGVGSGPTTGGGGGAPLGEDYTRWVYWWSFNKDRYLRLRDVVLDEGVVTSSDDFYMGRGSVHSTSTLRPTRAEIRDRVLPVIDRALANSRDRDVTMASLMALAKIADGDLEAEIVERIVPHLERGQLEVRETAVLALGVSQLDAAAPILVDLLADTAAARRMLGGRSVSARCRAFAAYGLGCIGAATPRVDLQQSIAERLRATLSLVGEDRDVLVATIHAIGALRPDPSVSRGRLIVEHCVRDLLAFYQRPFGVGAEIAQAHVPPALAKLLTTDVGLASTKSFVENTMVEELRKGTRGNHIRQSAVIALGMLAAPHEAAGDVGTAAAEALWHEYRDGKDQQARYFALLAMAQAGGAKNRERLLAAFQRDANNIERPWAALALGVLCREHTPPDPVGPDHLVIDSLRRELRTAKNPELLGAIAIALGLARAADAADDLRASLARYGERSAISGYVCMGLGMLGDGRAVEAIRQQVAEARNEPELLMRGAIALALLGQKSTALELVDVLQQDGQSVATVEAVTPALAMIGDRDVLAPLAHLADARDASDRARALAIATLGGIADKESLPWNERFAAHANYRASVETLGGSASGILDRY